MEFPQIALANIALSFDAAIDVFILSRHLKNLSPNTTAWYRIHLNQFASFASAKGETPANFSKETVLAYLKAKLTQTTPQTANGALRAIKAFANFLVAEGIRNDNPTKGIERLKEPLHFPRTLSDDQIVTLVNTIAKHTNTFAGLRDLTLVCLLLDTGLRISEALNLKVSDIDLLYGFVRVVGKGNRERVTPLGDSVRILLQRYMLKRASLSHVGDFLFVSTLGTKLTKRQAHARIKFWAQKAGIEGVRVSPHSLRFTFVRKWLQSGGDSLVLQRILGHSSPTMTSYYARLFASDLKDAHKRHSPIDSLAPILKLPRKRIQ